MRTWLFAFFAAASIAGPLTAQETSPGMPPSIPKAAAVEPATTSTVMRTNSMTVLDDKKKLGSNDFVSFRVVEDRDNESQHLRVNDTGELGSISPHPAPVASTDPTAPADPTAHTDPTDPPGSSSDAVPGGVAG